MEELLARIMADEMVARWRSEYAAPFCAIKTKNAAICTPMCSHNGIDREAEVVGLGKVEVTAVKTVVR